MKDSTINTFDTANSNAMLCDGFLIPMTDFIDKFLHTGDLNYQLRVLNNYKDFLKKPLKLEMFVPCDEDGNVLEKPEDYEKRLPNMMTEYNDEVYRYKQAKEKVLFVFKPHFDISVIKYHILQDRDIEYLANFGSMQLTKNALNAIFG